LVALKTEKENLAIQTRGKAAQQSQGSQSSTQTQQPPESSQAGDSQPRFQRKSPAEDDELITRLMEMILKGQLKEITPAHIFAASPAIRIRLVDYLKTHKVQVAHFELANHGPSSQPVSSSTSLRLREMEVSFGGRLRERAVLDSGSQIIVVREDLWKECEGVSMQPDGSINMESADSSVTSTLGILRNFPMTVGTITFYLQVQVVRQAPFRFLLGMPFWAISRARTATQIDGSMVMTLTDPNPPHLTVVMNTTPRGVIIQEEESFLALCRASPPPSVPDSSFFV
jgi:hypothetical protein